MYPSGNGLIFPKTEQKEREKKLRKKVSKQYLHFVGSKQSSANMWIS